MTTDGMLSSRCVHGVGTTKSWNANTDGDDLRQCVRKYEVRVPLSASKTKVFKLKQECRFVDARLPRSVANLPVLTPL